MADGGEGSIDVFRYINGYRYKTVQVKDPLGTSVLNTAFKKKQEQQ